MMPSPNLPIPSQEWFWLLGPSLQNCSSARVLMVRDVLKLTTEASSRMPSAHQKSTQHSLKYPILGLVFSENKFTPFRETPSCSQQVPIESDPMLEMDWSHLDTNMKSVIHISTCTFLMHWHKLMHRVPQQEQSGLWSGRQVQLSASL